MTIANDSSPDIAAATPTLLDAADGIARVIGDRALYARMLRRFHDDYRAGAAPIRAALAHGDVRLAQRIAHTLAGAAGMISAPALQRQARALELALHEAACVQPDAVDALDAALAEVLQLIERRLADEPAADRLPQAPPAAPLSGRALVAQLAALLASGDGAAVDLLEASGAGLRAALGESGLCAVTRAANEFDFEGALEVLRRVVDQQRQAARG